MDSRTDNIKKIKDENLEIAVPVVHFVKKMIVRPRLMQIYEDSRNSCWSPSQLPWDTLDVESMTLISATLFLIGLLCSLSLTHLAPLFLPEQ